MSERVSLREGQLFLLNPDVLVGVHQVPVHVFDLVDGGHDLQAEGHVGDFTIILGDPNEAIVRGESKTLQQVLRKPEIETGVELRAQWIERRVSKLPGEYC